jgi:methylated-DNA-[protein]-cysteine S-methyltransferase
MKGSLHYPPPKSEKYCVINAPFGRIGIATEMVEGSLMVSRIDYLPADEPLRAPQNGLAKELVRQCEGYFKNPNYQFDLPLKPTGSAYQQKVWGRIRDIPPGITKTYGELASDIQSAARAVGGACGANPYPLITPCHRVISSTGLGGFMKEDSPGFYRQIKIWLLRHEGVL